MSKRKLNRYNAAFKERAVALAEEIGVTRAARILGLKTGTLRSMTELKLLKLKSLTQRNPAETERIETARELQKLRKENKELKTANLILKEVAALFSKDPLPTSLGWSEVSKKSRQK